MTWWEAFALGVIIPVFLALWANVAGYYWERGRARAERERDRA